MMTWKICFLFVLSSAFVYKIFAGTGDDWNYEAPGPSTWSQTYPACAGLRQSPINLDYLNIVKKKFSSFSFSPNFHKYLLFNLENNGHTVVGELTPETSSSNIPQLTGGGLSGTFQFTNFHLHWGSSPSIGSEHTINGLHASGEAHFVFTNIITKQLAVLAFFMVAPANHPQSAWRSYVDNAVTLIHEGAQVQLTANLMKLMETENNFEDFWRYDGSLTTPPCTEGVIWTVFKSHIKFSYAELQALSLKVLHKDFRPIQLSNNRTIYHSTSGGTADYYYSWRLLILVLFLIRI